MIKKILFFSAILFYNLADAANGPLLKWGANISGSAADAVRALKADNSGNVYVAGTFTGTNVDFDFGPGTTLISSNGLTDIFIAKYSAAGQLIWVKTFGASRADDARAICLLNDNVWITGSFQDTVDFDPSASVASNISAGGLDMFVLKLDGTTGSLLWRGAFGGTGTDIGNAITPDGLNRIMVVGQFAGTADFEPGTGINNLNSAGSSDISFVCLDDNGSVVTARRIGGTGIDIGLNIKVGTGVNAPVAICGKFAGTVDLDWNAGVNSKTTNGGADAFIMVYNTLFQYQWSHSIGGFYTSDNASGVAIDATNNVLVSGFILGTTDMDPSVDTANISSFDQATYNGYVAKYSAAGTYQWAFTIPSPNQYDNEIVGITTDANNNIYATGRATTFDADPSTGQYNVTCSNPRNAFILKYNASAQIEWGTALTQINGVGTGDGYVIDVDASGNVIAGGVFYSSMDINPSPNTTLLTSPNSSNSDGFIVKYATCNYPTAPVTLADSACPGAAINLQANGTGIIGWYADATGNNYLGANNQVLQNIPTGTVTYWAQDSTCGAGERAAATFIVHPSPAVVLTANNITVCEGSNATLTATGTDNYVWSTFDTSAIIDVSPAYPSTTYYAIGTNQYGCSDTNSIQLYANALPEPNAVATDSIVCSGTTIKIKELDYDPEYCSFSWSTGATVDSIVVAPLQTTAYYITVQDENGCIGYDTVQVTVATVDVGISAAGNVLTSNETNAQSYQWVTCPGIAPITGANQSTYTAMASGGYAVIITNANGCEDTSACEQVTGVNIDNIVAPFFNVAPNPFTDNITIHSVLETEMTVEVYNTLGALIMYRQVSAAEHVLSLGNQSSGIYLLRVTANNKSYQTKLIKE